MGLNFCTVSDPRFYIKWMQTIFFSYFCEVPMRYIPQLKSDLPVYLRACLHGVSLCRHKNLQLSYGGWAGEASVIILDSKLIQGRITRG